MPEEIYSLEQVAKRLQVSERTIMREIKAGKIKAFKVGRALRFTPGAVEEYIKEQIVAPEDFNESDADGDSAA